MPSFTDQTGCTITLQHIPQRIVSLVPSQTELLYHLELDAAIVGVTKFCVHPRHWLSKKTVVGGTKTVHIDRVQALQPDLIIANKEENTKEQVEELAQICPVWTSNISNLEHALQMIENIGSITAAAEKADLIIDGIKKAFGQLAMLQPTVRTAYLVWQQPYMTVGGDTFISDMMMRCGFDNIFKDLHRYPMVQLDDIKNSDCQLLLLSSEPFPFKQEHIPILQEQVPSAKIILADGELFSWYGSRLLEAPAYFATLIKNV